MGYRYARTRHQDIHRFWRDCLDDRGNILRLTNTGQDPLTVYLLGRPTAFDVTIRRLDGRTVWRRLEGEVVSAILGVRELAPGAVLEFDEVWAQTSNTGEPVPPGDYRVVGVLPTDGPEPLQTSPALLRIVP